MAETSEILFETRGGVGFITLNRPQALNAQTLNMVRQMTRQLRAWKTDPRIHAVVVAGAGGRAFCAGGDIKAVALDMQAADAGVPHENLSYHFFREEYQLTYEISVYPKPYIALADCIVMGGGKGLSAHGSHRIITENTLFAMPETGIGFFPDVGGGYFLSRTPGQTGTYLALTSTRLLAVDTIYIGYATAYVPSNRLPALCDALAQVDWQDDGRHAGALVDDVVDGFVAAHAGESILAPYRTDIDTAFGFDRVEDIVAALESMETDWAVETLGKLYAMSPTSLKVTLRQIRAAAKMSFADVIRMEWWLSQHLITRHDYAEGVRAAVIDKDRAPKWQPARIAEVEDALVESFFQSIDGVAEIEL